MNVNELKAPVAVLQSQIRAASALETMKLRSGVLRGLDPHEYKEALSDAIDCGMIKKATLRVTKRGLSLLSHC